MQETDSIGLCTVTLLVSNTLLEFNRCIYCKLHGCKIKSYLIIHPAHPVDPDNKGNLETLEFERARTNRSVS